MGFTLLKLGRILLICFLEVYIYIVEPQNYDHPWAKENDCNFEVAVFLNHNKFKRSRTGFFKMGVIPGWSLFRGDLYAGLHFIYVYMFRID